ncbi:hypothetical protein BSL78_17312 [Apostichopus japonicus]|uniref:Uncharacterized protein n=1 Tax=Stichopus japonicus TaxID=307972 RepID=A0A2G8KCV9_STIJA|nr:hypothetical protein BSL78_17312 [Apostichopus japonicus]
MKRSRVAWRRFASTIRAAEHSQTLRAYDAKNSDDDGGPSIASEVQRGCSQDHARRLKQDDKKGRSKTLQLMEHVLCIYTRALAISTEHQKKGVQFSARAKEVGPRERCEEGTRKGLRGGTERRVARRGPRGRVVRRGPRGRDLRGPRERVARRGSRERVARRGPRGRVAMRGRKDKVVQF